MMLLLRGFFFWSVIGFCLLAAPALAQPGGGPGGGGPDEPPRSTPGLDPVTLASMATAGYFGVQAFRNRRR